MKKKQRIRRTDRITVAVLLLIIAAVAVSAFSKRNEEAVSASSPARPEVGYADYNGKKIGVLSGTNMEAESEKYFPDSEYFYYDGYPNLNAALLAGKIDAYLGDEPALKSIHAGEPRISYLKERLTENRYSFAFRKDDPDEKALCEEFNAFLQKLKEDGTYEEIDRIWFGTEEDKKTVDLDGLTGENGTIHVVTTATDEPFSYIKDGKNVGYDIDVAARFCRDRGYALEIGEVDFSARIPALLSGRYEFTTTLNVTPEREESVLFSDPVSEGGIVVAVRSEDLPEERDGDAEQGILRRIARSFEKNFIREDRWKLIAKGLGTTILITVLSVLLGTVLSYGICLYRRTESRLANRICDIYVRLLQGTPTVVLLMILYYIVFAKTKWPAIAVAVVGFTLNFGAYGSEIMRAGIESMGPGQREAALSLGYGEHTAFTKFVFPQAAVHFLPVLRGEMINLLKSTSVVGYISILDLTKMSDIIRGRTFEAFFPLITTALIYFALAYLITAAMRAVLARVDTRRRKGGKPA